MFWGKEMLERKYYAAKRVQQEPPREKRKEARKETRGEGKEEKRREIAEQPIIKLSAPKIPSVVTGALNKNIFSYRTFLSPELDSKNCYSHSRYALEHSDVSGITREFGRLGSGSYGVVSVGCLTPRDGAEQKGECKYAIKMLSSIETGEQEAYFLHLLQTITLNGGPIVPRLQDVWSCDGKFYYVMDRYEGDMKQVGREQFDELVDSRFPELAPFRGSGSSSGSIYNINQLRTMFQISYILSQNGIVFLDTKPDQFLYRQSPLRDGSLQIVLTDFGFSKQTKVSKSIEKAPFGWSGNLFKCGTDLVAEAVAAGPRIVAELNLWQLSSYLFADLTFIYDQEQDRIAIFAGYEISPELQRLVEKNCPKYAELKVETMKKLSELHHRTKIPFLTMDSTSLGL